MRIAIVAESFLPQANGVTDTVRHMVDELLLAGHEPLVIAPAPGLADYNGVEVVRVRSMSVPGYRAFPVGLPDGAVEAALARFRPDVVHLAAPIVLGAVGLRAARRLGIPTVAAYQTDVAAVARLRGPMAGPALTRWVGRIHRKADRTLAPSRSSMAQLDAMGVPGAWLWGRGVDLDQFDPRRRNPELHDLWARASHPGGERVVVGYVGRLVAEKQVRRLEEVARIPGTRVVVVGDGPERGWLEEHVPGITFTGELCGRELAQAFASLDVFVHPGESETFCEAVLEAQASGVPVVAAASGGPVDLVTHGRTGLLFDPTERTSLRRSTATLVGDPVRRRTLADRARAAVAGRTWQRAVEELVGQHYAAVRRGASGGSAAA
ncbi:MAG: glycosyltransferase family 4 protein [Nocardioidaceae bacterium]